MTFENSVQKMINLPWDSLSKIELLKLMWLSWVAAEEFTASLRIALEIFPDHSGVRKMAQGELATDNLIFDDYKQTGDHSSFLAHFLNKYGINPDNAMCNARDVYNLNVQRLDRTSRAMSVFHRETSLQQIFRKILQASDWSLPALAAYRYYLERHISLDSGEDGHAALTNDLLVQADQNQLQMFYLTRLMLYQRAGLDTLFTPRQ